MPTTLFVAPAGHGKTKHVLDLAREASANLQACPRVVVANRQQVAAWQRRLAEQGGCLGVHLMTFDDLFTHFLSVANKPYTRIGDAAEYRLLRALVNTLPLEHYRSIQSFPGFIQECQRLIAEMKSAQVMPDVFMTAVYQMGDAPRLHEIAQIYAAYKQYMDANALADSRGLGLLALEAAEEYATAFATDCSLLVVDGFASFTQTQLSLLHKLQSHIERIIITLTGTLEDTEVRSCHRHFVHSRHMVEETLGIRAQRLPGSPVTGPIKLQTLEAHLFSRKKGPSPQQASPRNGTTVQMETGADHAAEVRIALRWLKQRIVEEKIPLHDAALTARDISLYRPFIRQISDEFGLPVYFVDGPPLQSNPCIAAILSLLRLLVPASRTAGNEQPALPRRNFLQVLRSPYFDWQHFTAQSPQDEATGLHPEDIDRLEEVARWGRIIAGPQQWWEALGRLSEMEMPSGATGDDLDPETGYLPPNLPRGHEAVELQAKLRLMLQRLRPPPGAVSWSAFVRWLEDLLGGNPDREEAAKSSLNVVACIHKAEESIRDRDIDALRSFKDVLRGMIWAEETGLEAAEFGYTQFVEELAGATDGATYRPISTRQDNAVLVSDVVQGRGVPCRALAVMGLAEGLFPALLSEEPFLRENDRRVLRDTYDLPFESALDSREQQYFYEAVTRARQCILFTRPEQAASGATWEPSPFWREVKRFVDSEVPSGHPEHSSPASAASVEELLDYMATSGRQVPGEVASEPAIDLRWRRIKDAADRFTTRWSALPSGYNGLIDSSYNLRQRFGADYHWSPSRLESYLSCPHRFFLSSVLRIEPRQEPEEGLDARQFGNIYHRLLEETFRRLAPAQRNDLSQLRESLQTVAEYVLADAPRREGFRETAWWEETRQEILKNVDQTLEALCALPGSYTPTHFEIFFGVDNPLILERGDERAFVRGLIDRVDVDEQNRLRIVDYKLAAPNGYSDPAHREGRRLQLPLYALAAEQALGLGKVAEAFYWHVRHAEASKFTMQESNAQDAMEIAVTHAWKVIDGARGGDFAPEVPDGGCPSYCPGVAFCWRYEPQRSY